MGSTNAIFFSFFIFRNFKRGNANHFQNVHDHTSELAREHGENTNMYAVSCLFAKEADVVVQQSATSDP